MATVEQVLEDRKKTGILRAPSRNPKATAGGGSRAATTPETLNIALKNGTDSSNAWAYVTGLDIAKNNAPFFLQSDGTTPYYPSSPSGPNAPLEKACDISLGAPGSTTNATIPRIAGGRIWFSRDAKLTFQLNPGPAVVEPSVTNPKDANYDTFWSFAEFTFNDSQFFGNISYVDFVGVPVALDLQNDAGDTKSVPGVPPDGLDGICSQLQAQHDADGVGWDKLVVKTSSGSNLRALSPNSALVGTPNLFDGYYQSYVDAVWSKYASDELQVDTQDKWGVVTGKVSGDNLNFDGVGSFGKPSAPDVFSCSTGPFADQPDSPDAAARGSVTARLAAAFNRSTLLINNRQPAGEDIGQFYRDKTTNHYARIVHAAIPDGKGYAFPYDDVSSSQDKSVAGTVSDPNPKLVTVTFGGVKAASLATAAATAPPNKSSFPSAEEEKSRLLGWGRWRTRKQHGGERGDLEGGESGSRGGRRAGIRRAVGSAASYVARTAVVGSLALGSFVLGSAWNRGNKGEA